MLQTQFSEKLPFIWQNHLPKTCRTFKWEAAPTCKLLRAVVQHLMTSQKKKKTEIINYWQSKPTHFKTTAWLYYYAYPVVFLTMSENTKWEDLKNRKVRPIIGVGKKIIHARKQFLDKTHSEVKKLKHSATSYAFYRALLKTQKKQSPIFTHKIVNYCCVIEHLY